MQNPFGTFSQKLEVERGNRRVIGLAGYGMRKFFVIRWRKGKFRNGPAFFIFTDFNP
jgi:hypothetical protein